MNVTYIIIKYCQIWINSEQDMSIHVNTDMYISYLLIIISIYPIAIVKIYITDCYDY